MPATFRKCLSRWRAILAATLCVLVVAGALRGGDVEAAEPESLTVDPADGGRVFDGAGAVSAGASTRLLYDYPEPERSQILDYLFKPGFGAALQFLKVEIGGGTNSTDGSEATHMRARGEVNCDRGYEWWLMKEAKARNPNIKLAGLEWGAPGWFDGGFWSKDNIDYLVEWLGCAERHGLEIDNIGGWNERGYEKRWYKDLRKALDERGIDVRVVAADSFDWKIAEDMRDDPEFNDAVDVVGMHFICGHRTRYQNCSSTQTARQLGKPLWMSENSALAHDVGGGPIARVLNRIYTDAEVSGYMSWSAVSAWYANLPIADTGPLLAEWPWSGHYRVGTTIWSYAHTNQFSAPGWRYLDGASGRLDSGASYVTRKSPGEGDFSTVIESLDAQQTTDVSFETKGGFADETVRVWETDMRSRDEADHFVHTRDIAPDDGRFSLTVRPGHVYTVTTLLDGGKGTASPRAGIEQQMGVPYTENFDRLGRGDLAPYLSDLNGAFEAAPCAGGRPGTCYQQMTERKPIAWGSVGDLDPTTLLGDPRWSGDYAVSTKFRLQKGSYAELLGRISTQPNWTTTIGGYHLRVGADGSWRLYSEDGHDGNEVLDSGTVNVGPGSWHSMRLRMRGSTLAVFVDGERLTRVQDHRQTTGNVALRVRQWDSAQFDDLKVVPTAPAPDFVPQAQMSAEASSAQGFYRGYTFPASRAVDDRPETMWHSEFNPDRPPLPQSLTVDLGERTSVSELWVQPRYGNTANAMIIRYRVAVSDDGAEFTRVAGGSWAVSNATKKVVLDEPVQARYVRLVAEEGVAGLASVSELNVVR